MVIAGIIILNGCGDDTDKHDLLDGDAFNISFYSDNGECNMTLFGKEIYVDKDLKSEVVVEDGIYKTVITNSDIISINVDGNESKNLDGTIVFEDTKLENLIYDGSKFRDHEDDFNKNYVVSITSTKGVPICVYTCNEYDIYEGNLLNRITMDNVSLYVYKAEFQVVETSSIK